MSDARVRTGPGLEADEGVGRRARYASTYRVPPLTARGAGTGMTGHAVGPGPVLSRHLGRVLPIAPGTRTAAVEPGCRTRAAHLTAPDAPQACHPAPLLDPTPPGGTPS